MMKNKDQLMQMINNLNENGINECLYLFRGFDKIEEFNINTTPERIAELQQIEKQKAEKEIVEGEAIKMTTSSKREQLKKEYQKEFKMIGAQTDFWNQREMLAAIDLFDRYDSQFMKIVSSYSWGYIQGIRAERARKKKAAL